MTKKSSDPSTEPRPRRLAASENLMLALVALHGSGNDKMAAGHKTEYAIETVQVLIPIGPNHTARLVIDTEAFEELLRRQAALIDPDGVLELTGE